jgi:3-hydroxybutyryl-CoA dehydrogenase
VALTEPTVIGVLGAGTMGRGIAQVAATAGHTVILADVNPAQLAQAQTAIQAALEGEARKGRRSAAEVQAILARVRTATVERQYDVFAPCSLVIEAVLEQLDVKRQAFQALDAVTAPDTLLATNTSSLSVTAIAAACTRPERVLGCHFFNPAPVMPLVEVVPGHATAPEPVQRVRTLLAAWGKTTVVAADTPGFIVNRVARPFYGEALRLFEEGVADPPTIDWAMREVGGFRMGPFELMDLIGNDVNYTVTRSIFEAFYFDPRYRPSLIQKRMVDAGLLGRKSGRGYYDYAPGAARPEPQRDPILGRGIVDRIVAMLINEAADAAYLRIASVEDLDLAMTTGVHYPKGLLRWADEIGPAVVYQRLVALQDEYGDDRYRPSPLLRRLAREGRTFYP